MKWIWYTIGVMWLIFLIAVLFVLSSGCASPARSEGMTPVFKPHFKPWTIEAVPPPPVPVFFSKPRILPSHLATFAALLRTAKGTQSVLVIGHDLGHLVATLARTGLGVYWLTGSHGHDRAFGKPMSAVILSDELPQTNALAWSASHALHVGGLMFVPETMLMMDVYLHFYGMERTGLKLKQFFGGGYFTIYQKAHGGNGKHDQRVKEAA